jgi:hypothetical protein
MEDGRRRTGFPACQKTIRQAPSSLRTLPGDRIAPLGLRLL